MLQGRTVIKAETLSQWCLIAVLTIAGTRQVILLTLIDKDLGRPRRHSDVAIVSRSQ